MTVRHRLSIRSIRIDNSDRPFQSMRWLYYIPHLWPHAQRMFWADVMIIPDDPNYGGQSLWITVDAISNAENFGDEEWRDWHRERVEHMGDADFYMDAEKMDLAVRATDMNEAECLDWIARWMSSAGFRFTGFSKATLDEFAGRSQMADTIRAIQNRENRQ